MLVKIVAQIVFNVARHVDEHATLCEEENALHDSYQNDQSGIFVKLPLRRICSQGINRIAQDNWRVEFEQVGHKDASNAKSHFTFVRHEITDQFFERSHYV